MSAQQEDPGDARLVGSFAWGADRYDRLRPEHPGESVAFCVPRPRADVVDIGAGTGKLTQALVEAGHRVVAVEPSVDMRTTLTRRLPGVPVHDASAEATGLPDRSVDVATFAQSWHWVDIVRASAELERIVRPGGYVSMVWTMLQDTVPWVERVQAAMHGTALAWQLRPGEHEQLWDHPPVGAFGGGERHTVGWSMRITRADLAAMVTTRSYYLESSAAEQDALLARVRVAVAEELPPGADQDPVDLPWVSTSVRYRREH